MIKITVHEKYLINYPIDGTVYFNATLAMYRDNILTWGQGKVVTQRTNDGIIHIDIPDSANIPFESAHFKMMLQLDNGTVEGFNTWLKIPESIYLNEIQEGLPNRTYSVIVDDSDPDNIITEELVHTWKSWKKINYTVTLIDGFYYYLSYAVTDKAAAFASAEWSIVLGVGVDVVNTPPYPIEEDVL